MSPRMWGKNEPANGRAVPRMWGKGSIVETKLIYPELSYKIQGGLFKVQNEVGIGRPEEVYHQAFKIWLSQNDILFQSKPPYPLHYKGELVHKLYPDLIIEDKIIIELKAKPRELLAGDWVQIMNYLKCCNAKLGLLVNMGLDRVYIQRIVREHVNCAVESNWHAIAGMGYSTLNKVQEILETIFKECQSGYGREIVDKFLLCAFQKEEVSVHRNPLIETSFMGNNFGPVPVECLILDSKVVFCHTALFENHFFSRSRALAFMKDMNLPYGLAVNFGKELLKIEILS